MKSKRNILFYFIAILLSTACNKLDVKPRQSLVVPSTLTDFQGLMDNDAVLNLSLSTLGEIGSDDFYVTTTTFNTIVLLEDQNAYFWNGDIFKGVTFDNDWERNYAAVFYSNVVLDGMNKIRPTSITQTEYNNIKGQALFHRAYAFYLLSQEYAPVYKQATAALDLGIVLRLNSDLNVKSKRSTDQQTYDQMISDLSLAKNMLPNIPLYKTRPSKPAVFAMLSRIYLAKQDYKNALLNADSCLKLNGSLINYNTLDSTASFPFAQFNEEEIYHDVSSVVMLRPTKALVDSNLCKSYADDDLRKSNFLASNGNGTYRFKGNYNGSSSILFCGIATDELYLIGAECNARLGNIDAAMKDYNTLLVNRYKTGTYSPGTATTTDDALSKILPERRKELLFRFQRWNDLRRLNQDPRYAVTLTRNLNSVIYTLPPNDKRYTLPIPDYIVAQNGIQQNP